VFSNQTFTSVPVVRSFAQSPFGGLRRLRNFMVVLSKLSPNPSHLTSSFGAQMGLHVDVFHSLGNGFTPTNFWHQWLIS